jgi:hypothetical protein
VTLHWQDHLEARATGRRFDAQLPMMSVHDLLHQIEPKARSMSLLLRCEEWLEDAVTDL